MQCNICGSDKNIKWSSRQFLCSYCAADTPEKISRDEFDRAYWGNDFPWVPASTRKEFYADYKTSSYDLNQYILATHGEVI